MKLRSLIDAYNEDGYKVLVLFGFKLRIRSKVLQLRLRMDEAEHRCNRLERELQAQKKLVESYHQQMEQKLAALEQQASERFNALSCNLTESEKKWDTGLRRLRESVEINRDRLEKLEGLDLDTRCSQNADATREVSARLADLEQLNLGAICELNRQEVAAVEKRISAIESQKLDEACEQNRQATAAVEERLSAIESQKLDEACEQNRQATAAVEKRLSTIESQKLEEACELNRRATAAVEERISAIESQKLDAACEQNREAANKIGQRVAQLEELDTRIQISERGILSINNELGKHRESVKKEFAEQRKEVQNQVSVQLAPVLTKLGTLERGLAEQGELRDSLRNHVLRTTHLGKRFEGWPQSYQQCVLSHYKTLDFERRHKNRVIVKMTEKTTGSGLADRLRTMLTAYVLAAESSREFYIYHDCGFKLEEYLRSNQVKWEIPVSDISNGLNKVYSIFLLRQYEDLSKCQRECHVFQSCTDIDTDFLPPELSEKYTNHKVFHQLFKFTPKVRNAARNAMREQSLRKNGYVAAHIRFLNFFEPVEKGGCVTSTEEERMQMVQNVYATLEKIHLETKKKILLFSDSNTMLKSRLPDYVKVLSGSVGHIVRHNGDGDVALKAFVDLLVMSQARAVYSIIGENIYEATVSKYGGQQNGFAKTAAYIGDVPFIRYKIVDAP